MNLKGYGKALLVSVGLLVTFGCQQINEDKLKNASKTTIEVKHETQGMESEFFKEEQGKFYLYGITLKDKKSHVIHNLGENYKQLSNPEEYVFGGDFIFEFDNVRVYFQNDLVKAIEILEMDEAYYEELYNSSIVDGLVYKSSGDEYNVARYFYSENNEQLLVAKYQGSEMKLFAFLIPTDKHFLDALESGEIQKVLE
ncbi:hypothetical protein [Metasolibacillus meyeri]|uniref:hypothetical protein n=1 Tax=Metasolibacillus meyeri TaxID=1071052 RepID=UPI000D322A5B|nr:hypothetical protein [Metasolibacillus meyeri]